ncbi:MAG: acyl-CoA dehydrogenase family protein [Acidimicrobiia bacterium]
MDFAFDDDQELLRRTTRAFLEQHQSLAGRRAVLEADELLDRGDWRRGAELGWTAMLVPPEHDGGSVTEQPVVDLAVLGEELGRVLHPGPFVPTNVVADAVARSGSNEQRAALLPGIANGSMVAAWCTTADSSADESSVDVRARPRGDGYRLDGVAGHVHGATVADILLVTARTGDQIVLALVRVPAAGIAVQRHGGLDLTRRFARVRFEDALVPGAAVLAPGRTADALERALALATVLQSAEAVGAADHIVTTTVQYAKDRFQFGRPIGSFQAVKHRLVDLLITLEGMRAAARYAALALADGFADADEAVAVAGSYVSDALVFVCGEALQLHGGIGFTWEHDVHLFVRRAIVDRALYGDPSWHRERLCRILDAATPSEPASA